MNKYSKLFKRVRDYVNFCFPHFGVNKKQQIMRLLYEISKKERVAPENILRDKNFDNFITVKTYLLKRRFPYAYSHSEISKPFLPKLDLNPAACAKIKKRYTFYPIKVFIEASAKKSTLARKFRIAFADATFTEIKSLKDYMAKRKTHFSIQDYNARCNTVFITDENQDFFKKCPCANKAYGCGYHIFNLAFGCIYECTYCYLQEYTNVPGLIFPSNPEKFFDAFKSYKIPGMRLGTGEFSDSLMLDELTEYSTALIDFFSKHEDVTFEFKTKSSNIQNLLKAKHSGNIVVSWSVNPQKIINEYEFYTATLTERINSARRCARAGYKLGFHFDPVIYFKEWQKHYQGVIEILFGQIKPKDIAWISIGTLRFNPRLKRVIENRFPSAKLLDEELLIGYDNKLRYPDSMRLDIYKKMIGMLSKHGKKLPIYLCMEEKSMWKNLSMGSDPFVRKSAGKGLTPSR